MTTDHGFPRAFVDGLTRTVEARQGRPRAGGAELEFTCPRDGHEDRHPSARWNPAKATWFCPVCNLGGGALDLADLLDIDKPTTTGRRAANAKQAEGARSTTSDTTATAQPPAGCTLARYAEAKGIDPEALRSYGLSDTTHDGAPAVRMPYRDENGQVVSTQYRVRLDKATGGDGRFRFKAGSRAVLYGQDRLALARERGRVALVEGASASRSWP